MTDDVTAESPDDTRARPDTADIASDRPASADAHDASRARAGDVAAGGVPSADAGEESAGGADEAETIVAAEPDAVAESDAPAEPDAVAESDAAVQRDEYYDLLLRKTAEFDNYRKRVERERVALAAAAAADLLEELLPVVDNLERALEAQVDEAAMAAAYRDGVELIHRQMLDLLRKRGVTPIETAGQDFDPNLHQAIAHEESTAHRAGEIIGEVRRGYMLGSRLLRAAMVRVAKT
jgi:molecular chaperone GrpE